jgi:methionine synthase II (cobalamin-independent)
MSDRLNIKPFSTTGIGSLPHSDAIRAASLSLEALDIPFWPQLPNISFREAMVAQYSEGMPSVRIEPDRQAIWVERNDEEIARFYETTEENSKIAISEDYAKGLYSFLNLLKSRRFDILKGHITGPLTFTLGLMDAAGKPVYYDEELREISLMLLKAKARWQIDILGKFAKKIIIFIDEPILSALGGTSYMGVSTDEAERLLKEVASAVKAAGGIAGIHCCGRADWPMVLQSGVDIMNFDAYGFGDTLAIYPSETRAFLEQGGVLAWGMVPTTEDIEKENEESILRLFRKRLETLSGNVPEELLLKGIMLTPSCGTGSRSVEETLKVFQLLMRLKEALT